MNNFLSFNYNSVIPSKLSYKNIIMIGRADDKLKRFYLGFQSMEYIKREIPEAQMLVVSNISLINEIKYLRNNLELNKAIKFVEYISIPEIYFNNVSLHIFPTVSESFGLVLGETKIYGIPNILIGLDYVSIVKGGTKIIYDEQPESLAKEAIKILSNNIYKKKMSKDSRKSMKRFNNEILLKKWIKLILAVFNGKYYYMKFRIQDKKLSEKYIIKILENQINLLKKRNKKFKNITEIEFQNFSFIKNFIEF